jgi:predicted RNA-binding Zn-ribbon protein involved in translation (DUF1610 family)
MPFKVTTFDWQPVWTALLITLGAFIALLLFQFFAARVFWRAVFWWKTRKRETTPYPCPICGYDIRATPHRCPECGTKLMWGVLPRE